MNVYELEKWYFDLLTREDEYIFGYLSRHVLLDHTNTHFHLCVADLDTTRSRTSKENLRQDNGSSAYRRLVTDHGTMSFSPSAASISFETDGLELDLDYQVESPRTFADESLSIPGRRGSRIIWHPVILKGSVSGRVILDGHEFQINRRDGYIDYLHSNVFPRYAPVNNLFWGRLHAPEFDFTWTYTLYHDRTSACLYCQIGDRPVTLTDVRFETDAMRSSESQRLSYPALRLLEARGPGVQLTAEFGHDRLTVESGFIDEQVVRNPFSRRLYRWLARYPRGIKFMGRGDVRLEYEGKVLELKSTPLIDEFVLFGKDPLKGVSGVL